MVTDGNQTYHGDHFEIYINIESLCCVKGTNIALQGNYTSETTSGKFEICGYQRWEWQEREMDEGSQKAQTSNSKLLLGM